MADPKIEEYRLSILSDLVSELRKPGQFAPGSFGCHEALDRTSLLVSAVDDLSTHPAIAQNKEWFAMAYRATSVLADLYQAIGEVHLSHLSDA